MCPLAADLCRLSGTPLEWYVMSPRIVQTNAMKYVHRSSSLSTCIYVRRHEPEFRCWERSLNAEEQKARQKPCAYRGFENIWPLSIFFALRLGLVNVEQIKPAHSHTHIHTTHQHACAPWHQKAQPRNPKLKGTDWRKSHPMPSESGVISSLVRDSRGYGSTRTRVDVCRNFDRQILLELDENQRQLRFLIMTNTHPFMRINAMCLRVRSGCILI